MKIKMIECNDCGEIFSSIEELDISYMRNSKSYYKVLTCPFCGDNDCLNFIVDEIDSLENDRPNFHIGVNRLHLIDYDLINEQIVFRPTIFFVGHKGYYISDKEHSLVEFETFDEAKAFIDEYKLSFGKNIEEKEFTKLLKEMHTDARELGGQEVS